jgi:hypothetical protein
MQKLVEESVVEDVRLLKRKVFVDKYKTKYKCDTLRSILTNNYDINAKSIEKSQLKVLVGKLYDLIQASLVGVEVISEIDEGIYDFRFYEKSGKIAGEKAIRAKYKNLTQLRRILIREFGYSAEDVSGKNISDLVKELVDQLEKFQRIFYDDKYESPIQEDDDEDEDDNEDEDDEDNNEKVNEDDNEKDNEDHNEEERKRAAEESKRAEEEIENIQKKIKAEFGDRLRQSPRVVFQSFTDGWNKLRVRSESNWTCSFSKPEPECQVYWGCKSFEVFSVAEWNEKIYKWDRMFPRISTLHQRTFTKECFNKCWLNTTNPVWEINDGVKTRSAINPMIPNTIKKLFRVDMWGNVLTIEVK